MPGHDIVVVGASAGGVEVLAQLVRDLPADLPAAIFVVLHIPSQATSVLPNILNRSIKKRQPNSPLQAVHPHDGEKIEYGRIYVAPPDHHLIVKNGYIRLARGPKENSHRPAVDPLFRTAARTYGRRVVGVVLSGTLDDGTAGLLAIKQRGGVAIVQNPDEAQYSGMPRSAIENVDIDQILRVSEIAPVLRELAYQPVAEEGVEAVPHEMEMEADMAELELKAMQNLNRPGTPSPYGCPECNGVLWQLNEGKLIRFRCRTGHAFSPASLLAKQSEALEDALWNALRALEEKAALTQKLASRARDRNQSFSTKRFEEQAQVAQQQATLVRNLLLQGEDNVSGGNGDKSTVKGQVVGAQLIAEQREEEDKGIDLSVVSPSPHLTACPSSLQVVAICASAGGLNALSQVLSALPADFPAAITVVQHLSRHQPSMMADILSRRIALQVKQAEAGDCLRPGTVYIAPPDNHLLINPDGNLSLSHSELVHFVRPSADLLFESVAASFKQGAIAVVLTGRGSDGSMGVRAIKEMGGTVIAQDCDTSEYYDMPEAAINTGVVDWVVPLNEIATTLVNLVNMKAEELNRT